MSFGVCSRVATWSFVVALVLTVAGGAAAQVPTTAWSTMTERAIIVEKQDGKRFEARLIGAEKAKSEPSPPSPSPPSPPPPHNRVEIGKLLGRQVTATTGDQEVQGKLVEVNDASAVIEKDGGERVTLARDQITAARLRFSQPPPTSGSGDSPPSGSGDSPSDDDVKVVDGDRGQKKATLPGYIGFIFRPGACVVNCAPRGLCVVACSGGFVSFGGEIGYKFIGLALRGDIEEDYTFLSPDIRFFYEFVVTHWFTIAPSLEFTPAAFLGRRVTAFQFAIRPAVRFGFLPIRRLMLYLEPIAMDLGVYTSGASGHIPNRGVVVRLELTLGTQFRF